jgi:microcystin-dependent protein
MGRFGKPCNAPFEFWTSGHTPSNGSWDSLISASGGNGTNGSGTISIVGNLNVSGNVTGVNISNSSSTPAGAVMAFYRSTAPSGWLECNGTTVSRTTYVNLWNAMGKPNTGNGSTTFSLPDLRGEFIRGWDHGRNLDGGRGLGSLQHHSLQKHTHTYFQLLTAGSGAAMGPTFCGVSSNTGDGTDSSTGTFSTETRPRNIALMYCIKT